jgi:hypothetical protein
MMTKFDINIMDQDSIVNICKLLEIVSTLMIKRHDDFLPISIVIIECCLISGHPAICEIIGINLGKSMEGLLDAVKVSALVFFFDIVELFIIVSPQHRKELVYFVMERVPLLNVFDNLVNNLCEYQS